jgi:hypothetical protein
VGARTRHAADGVFATAQSSLHTYAVRRRRNLLARSLQMMYVLYMKMTQVKQFSST